MSSQFEDIRILHESKERTHRSNGALYKCYFVLSSVPPPEWCQIFERERQTPRHLMWRKAWIEEGYIVVECPLDEIKEYHFKGIKEDTAGTNRKYREHLQNNATKKAIKKSRQSQFESQEKKNKNDALDGLDFD